MRNVGECTTASALMWMHLCPLRLVLGTSTRIGTYFYSNTTEPSRRGKIRWGDHFCGVKSKPTQSHREKPQHWWSSRGFIHLSSMKRVGDNANRNIAVSRSVYLTATCGWIISHMRIILPFQDKDKKKTHLQFYKGSISSASVGIISLKLPSKRNFESHAPPPQSI